MLVKRAVFDTEALSQRDRRAAYQRALDNALDTEFIAPDFTAEYASYAIGDQHMIWLDASPRRSERTRALIERDSKDAISFQYAVKGDASGWTPARKFASRAGSILVLDLAQPFVVEDHERRIVVNLAVPRPHIQRIIDDPAALHGIIVDGGAGALLADLMRSTVSNISHLPSSGGPAIALAFLELIRVMLTTVTGRDGGALVHRSPAAIERALALIQRRIGSRDLTPDWLALQLNMSRSQLYALFRGQGGVSKTIWRQRLEAARASLATDGKGRRISEIAYAFGFATESHFTRTFKEAYGVTPRSFRLASVNQSQR